MPLKVYTARIGCRDPDVLNITRLKGRGDGLAFAPSNSILQPALAVRALSREIAAVTNGTDIAARVHDAMWALYRGAFAAEMKLSYREQRPAWERTLARDRIVLVCFCTTPQCHRVLVAEFLAKCGATNCGELAIPPKRGR